MKLTWDKHLEVFSKPAINAFEAFYYVASQINLSLARNSTQTLTQFTGVYRGIKTMIWW